MAASCWFLSLSIPASPRPPVKESANCSFLTFRATPHLDGKHTVFGHVVGGDATLDKIEKVPSDPVTDRPRRPVRITDVAIFKVNLAKLSEAFSGILVYKPLPLSQDPFEEHQQREAKRQERELAASDPSKLAKKQNRATDRTTWFGTNLDETRKSSSIEDALKSNGVGRYVTTAATTSVTSDQAQGKRKEGTRMDGDQYETNKAKKRRAGNGFGSFEAW
jgi:peptidyl-prolyl cis-trans isomerase-like 2